jgi:hypothetical protein
MGNSKKFDSYSRHQPRLELKALDPEYDLSRDELHQHQELHPGSKKFIRHSKGEILHLRFRIFAGLYMFIRLNRGWAV